MDNFNEFTELSAEDLGSYLLNYLKELSCPKNETNNQLLERKTLVSLIILFHEKIKILETNSLKKSKLRNDLECQLSLIARKYSEIFLPSAPPQKIKITSERGRLVGIDSNCIECSMKLRQGWQFHTNVGDIYFCSLCKEQISGTGNFRSTNMWSKMVFSGFETNRRKH